MEGQTLALWWPIGLVYRHIYWLGIIFHLVFDSFLGLVYLLQMNMMSFPHPKPEQLFVKVLAELAVGYVLDRILKSVINNILW